MGLDGISINQLRIGPDINSNELNISKVAENNRFIDGLAEGQRINPDERKEKQNKQNGKNLPKGEAANETEDTDESLEGFENIDLSDSKKYVLKVDDKTNNILIIDKETDTVVQNFNPESLSNLTKYLTNYTGVLINRKY